MKRAEQRHPQLDFLEAQLALRDGDLPRAIRIFRALLTTDPALIRVRLELARALFLARDFEAARYHFEIALGERDLPETTRANILGFLRRITAQVSTFRVTAMLVPDTNANQATSANEINILGRTFTLNEDARARRAVGLALIGESRHAFGPEHRSFVRSYFEHRDYPERRADFTYGQASVGHSVFLGQSTVSAELGPHASIYQGVRLYSGGLWQITHFRPLTQRLLLSQSLLWRRLSYPRFEFLSGRQAWLTHELRYALDNVSALTGAVGVGANRAREAPYSYRAWEWRAGYLRELTLGFIVELRIAGNRFDYDGELPLFGEVRHDRQRRFELDATRRDWSFYGFAPRLLLSFTSNRSNLPLYAYRRSYYGIGLTREF